MGLCVIPDLCCNASFTDKRQDEVKFRCFLVFYLVWVLCPVPLAAETLGDKAVHVRGVTDCGEWIASRHGNTSVSLEHYVIGMINGLTIGADKEFWNHGAQTISWDAVYLWIDGYCRSHPTDLLTGAVLNVFKARTGLQ